MDISLPGGLAEKGRVQHQAGFRPLTGRIELALIELNKERDRSSYVTAVLNSVVESIGNQPISSERASNLCIADRQYLMLRLAALLNGEQMWLKAYCGHCEAPFDIDVQRSDLPVKKAGEGYPNVTVRVNGSVIIARVLTGADQQAIGEQKEEQAMQQLLQRSICTVDGKSPSIEFIKKLTESDIEAIDEALDDISPAVCNQLLVTCPNCRQEQYVELDHYDLANINEYYFYDEVHTLASHYHWSEAAILDLPQCRRRLYLDKISRSAGMSEQGRMS